MLKVISNKAIKIIVFVAVVDSILICTEASTFEPSIYTLINYISLYRGKFSYDMYF